MTVTIAIPYYQHPDTIERCVRSALAQTHRDIRVVVVGDGEMPPLDIQDPRLVTYALGRNHGGAPYAQQVALLATPDRHYAPLGADDWIESTHIQELLMWRRGAVATGSVWFQRQWPEALTRPFVREVEYEVGLFRTDRLRAFGGYDPSARVAQDNLILGLLDRYGGLVVYRTDVPTYHRIQKYRDGGGMSKSSETGAGSKVREAADADNALVLRRARGMSSSDLRAWRESRLPKRLQTELAEDVAGLRQWML